MAEGADPTGRSEHSLERHLDNPAWSALTGPQAEVAAREGRAARYPIDVAPFAALAEGSDESAWLEAARLPGAGDMVLVAPPTPPPTSWEIAQTIRCLQMLARDLDAEGDPEAVVLGRQDVPDMLDLVARTRPGPFLPRTYELGRYMGIRRSGVLVAMAGERMRPFGWTEVSAVCTDESVRGEGLATRLIRAVVAGIRDRGDEALLHVASANSTAIRLYRSLGFVERREIDFMVVRAPVESSRRED
jgi:ribosomal protein S18 acetylase RimI-like enzyme